MTAALLLLSAQSSTGAELAKIGFERGTLEASLVRQERFNGFDRIASMTLGPPSSVAYYPIGVSNQRFMLIIDSAPKLLYQELRNGRATTVGFMKLVDGKDARPNRGSIRRLIRQSGSSTRGSFKNKAANKMLNAEIDFAAYSVMSAVGTWYMQVHFKDGRLSPAYLCDSSSVSKKPYFLPILPEEAKLLGLGDRGWVASAKFSLRPARG